MRKAITTLLAIAALSTAVGQDFNTRVIPTPQRVERTQGFCPSSAAPTLRHVGKIAGASSQEQAYRIVISTEGITLEYVDADGMEYGEQFVAQLAEVWGDSLPCMTVVDWPAFAFRGYLDDVSRGPIPNSKFIERQLKMADRLRLNASTYYTEHTLYSDSMPDLAPLAARQLPTVKTHPSIIPNLQCFAHFEKTFQSPFYDDIKDSPTTLNPGSAQTYDFLKQRIGQVAQSNIRAKMFHINCDETEALGSGRARQYVERIGSDEAYCRHVNRVAKLLRPYHFRPLMWADIVAKNPVMTERLPADMTYIVWSYAPQPSYTTTIDPIAKTGRLFWVAASVNQASTIAPDPEAWPINIANLARDGAALGAEGFLVTAWDDSGEALFGSCFYAVAWAAEMAWHPITATNPDEAQAELEQRRHQFDENYARLFDSRELASFRTLQRLHSNPDIASWFAVDALYAPLSGKADTLRARRVEAIIGSTPTDSLTPYARYALHRIALTAEKQHLMATLADTNRAEEASNLTGQFMTHLLDLKREYLRLWDYECGDYWRDRIAKRYDDLGFAAKTAQHNVRFEVSHNQIIMSTQLADTIYYTTDGSRPTRGSEVYTSPVALDRSATVRAVVFDQWGEPYYSQRYVLLHGALGARVTLGSQPSTYREAYRAGGDGALTDGLLGSDEDYADGHWQGFQGCDLDAALDLGSSQKVETLTMRFLQLTRDWILSPQTVEVYTSRNGRSWQLAHTQHFEPDFRTQQPTVVTLRLRNLGLNTRHIRVVARNAGPLPSWHPSAGQPSYLFCDEIVVGSK